MNADDILTIPLDEPERIFSRESHRDQFRELLVAWHPDHAAVPRASEVIMHLKALHDSAVTKLAAGAWTAPFTRLLIHSNGLRKEVPYLSRRRFELGEMLVGEDHVTFVVDAPYRDLAHHALTVLDEPRPYPDETLRNQIEPDFPHVRYAFETHEKQVAVAFAKPASMLLLADVIAYRGRLDPRAAAWVISRLYHFCCWASYAQFTHNAIAPDTVFLAPPTHTVTVFGGWWYAARRGAKMLALPRRSAQGIPRTILAAKRASPLVDLTLVKQTAREMLGCERARRPEVPEPFYRFLITASSDNAIADYAGWEKAREASFGPPQFTKMSLTATDLYPRKTVHGNSAF